MKQMMNTFRIIAVLLFFTGLTGQGLAADRELTVVIMQDDRGAAERYRSLKEYLGKKGVPIRFIAAPNYTAAATMFSEGKGDAMFSGSAVAGIMMLKELADPLVRQVSSRGISKYNTVVVAKKGDAAAADNFSIFNGKRVIFNALASAGEIYFRSLPQAATKGAIPLSTTSHGAALDALSRGAADLAIVKNSVWNNSQNNYPGLILVKQEKEEYPDMTLMISAKADPKAVKKLSGALLTVRTDKRLEARTVRRTLDIQGFIKTTRTDFKDTFTLLQRAGISRSSDFNFR